MKQYSAVTLTQRGRLEKFTHDVVEWKLSQLNIRVDGVGGAVTVAGEGRVHHRR